jgi:hypothetical protein
MERNETCLRNLGFRMRLSGFRSVLLTTLLPCLYQSTEGYLCYVGKYEQTGNQWHGAEGWRLREVGEVLRDAMFGVVFPNRERGSSGGQRTESRVLSRGDGPRREVNSEDLFSGWGLGEECC